MGVPAGNLTHTFQFAGRETGLLMDKFAFGYQGFFYTVGNLDTGSAPTGTPPPPPPPPVCTPIQDHRWRLERPSSSVARGARASKPAVRFVYFNKVTPENAGKLGLCRGHTRCDELDQRRYGLQPGQG